MAIQKLNKAGEPIKKPLEEFLVAYDDLNTYRIKNEKLAKSLENLHPKLTKRFLVLSKKAFVG